MKIEKLKSGSYRVRKYYNGKSYSMTFDRKPTEKEILEEFNKRIGAVTSNTKFKDCCRNYIDVKSNVLSPTTIREYEHLLTYLTPSFANTDILSINQLKVQNEINFYSVGHSPKSVRNFHGFISSVLGMYYPELVLRTTLPQKEKKDPYIPSKEEVNRILEESKDTRYYIPLRLACYGLRRSELICITSADLDGNVLTINKALVQDINGNWITKSTKTTESTRKIYIDDELRDMILDQGYSFKGNPECINQHLHKVQDRLEIKRFNLHKLRHYFVSMLSDNGVPEASILKLGGYSSPSVMKSIYRHSIDDNEKSRELQNYLF